MLKIKSLTHSEIDRRERSRKTKVYIWPEGENVIENLQNRRSRPYSVYRKEVIPQVLAELGIPADARVRWSQRAGCSCPCSPGFIIEGYYGREAFVTVTE